MQGSIMGGKWLKSGAKKAPKEGQTLGKVSKGLLAFKDDAKD